MLDSVGFLTCIALNIIFFTFNILIILYNIKYTNKHVEFEFFQFSFYQVNAGREDSGLSTLTSRSGLDFLI